MTECFQRQAALLRQARIREQYKEDDRARRTGRAPRILPPSITAAQIQRQIFKLRTFGLRHGYVAFYDAPWNEYPSNQIATLRNQWMETFK